MNKLKTITAEINKLFLTDYNCSSFSSLKNLELLQMLIDVLTNFSIMQKVNIKIDKEKATLEILNALEAIKYNPRLSISPSEFRNGLMEAQSSIVYPILHWLLTNKDDVQTRHYLSKFVSKLEIPEEDLVDTNLKSIYQNYCMSIDNFWIIYKENKIEKQNAMEMVELENDIFEMKRDLSNLKNHLKAQANRIENISHKDEFLDSVHKFCKETKQRNKISKQLEEENANLEQLKCDLRKYERRDRINNLDDMLEKAQCNKYYCKQLSKQLDDFKIEVDVHETVCNESEPDYVELENILQEMQDEKNCIQQLKKQKSSKSNEAINASIQHSKVLGRKKDCLSKEVMKLRLQNEELLHKIEQTCSLLGGDVLQGKSLKEYVAKLREQSLIYKKDKQYLNSFKKEISILEHTLELLHLENPEIRNNLKMQIKNENIITKECRAYDQDKIKLQVRKLHRSYETARSEISAIDKNYRKTKTAFERLSQDYRESKNQFDELTGYLTDSVRQSEVALKRLNEKFKEESRQLRKYNDDAEFYKECLLKYSHGIIENAGDVSYTDGVAHKLRILEEIKDDLVCKLDVKEEEKLKVLKELESIKNIKDMVLEKLNN